VFGGGACYGVLCHWVMLQVVSVCLGNMGLGDKRVGDCINVWEEPVFSV
jgi:hypothetical protein